MLKNAKKNADDAKAAKQKSALSVAELEAQMLKMMSPPKPAGKPTAAKKSADAKKKPMNIKELEQNMLKGAAKTVPGPGNPTQASRGRCPEKASHEEARGGAAAASGPSADALLLYARDSHRIRAQERDSTLGRH